MDFKCIPDCNSDRRSSQQNGRQYSLQEEIICKDNTIECMQKKMCALQNEMRLVAQENSLLSGQVAKCSRQQQSSRGQQGRAGTGESSCNPKCPSGRPDSGASPREDSVQKYCKNTVCLENQLNNIELEVKRMQGEFNQVRRDRQQLEDQKKLLKCAGPDCLKNKKGGTPCQPCPPSSGRDSGAGEQALRELKEQYATLQDDFKSKVTEVSFLRREIESLKEVAEKAKAEKEAAETLAKTLAERQTALEQEAKRFVGSKEQLVEQEQQLAVAKQRFRESQDELEELRGLIQDQVAQLEDYRNKYLQAQQLVEEQRRQIEMMELDNNRINEQVALEIQRVKNQFQERLQELTPLPDILKATQSKLQESQQLRAIAERNCEDMARELQEAKDKCAQYAKQLDDSVTSSNMDLHERGSLKSRLKESEKRLQDAKDENSELKTTLARLEEAATQNQQRLDEKLHEIAQLSAQIETVREESARQVARTKERCETVRRSLQNQISELERQLAQSRAAARTAQKDRDEIRQRMQGQINSLNENFDQAQLRIRGLQGHVNYLKTSYSNIFNPDQQNSLMLTDEAGQNCGCDQY